MRRAATLGIVSILGLMLLVSGNAATYAQGATDTPTPSLTANFILPFINVPIQLPTSFMPIPPTLIVVHVTPGVNMNPHGFNMPNPIQFWEDQANYLQAVVAITGWMGNLFWFVFLLFVFMALFKRIFNKVTRQTAIERRVEAQVERKTGRFLR